MDENETTVIDGVTYNIVPEREGGTCTGCSFKHSVDGCRHYGVGDECIAFSFIYVKVEPQTKQFSKEHIIKVTKSGCTTAFKEHQVDSCAQYANSLINDKIGFTYSFE